MEKNIWIGVMAFSGIIILLSSYADKRRANRADVDRVGFMPWTWITVMSVLAAVVSAALAIKGA